MTSDDEEFEVRTGRSRSERPKGGFAARVRREAARQGPSGGRSRGRFNRTGAGRAVARAQALGEGASRGARRVVVKARVVKLGKGASPAVHLRYLQRDGANREGGRGVLYGAVDDRADGRAFLARGEGDPHQFRFIVAPEDGADLADQRAFIRDLMGQVEQDLGAPLDWVAVDHFNTGHPHSHVVLRGRDREGRPLFIAGDYIAHGIRGRASALVTLELGPETATDVRRRLANEVSQHRLTGIDRAMLRDVEDGLDPARGQGLIDRALRLGRLATLEGMGLAQRDAAGRWSLRADMRAVLRQLGERDDVIKSIHAAMRQRGGASAETLALHEQPPVQTVTGRLVGRRLSDDLGDRLAVVVDGFDGRIHHLVVAGPADAVGSVPLGAIVSLGPPPTRPADRAIAEIAAANGGDYQPSRHMRARRAEGGAEAEAFVEAHVRRLEALRRRGVVTRMDADTWSVPRDFLDRAAAADGLQGGRGVMRVLSLLDLDAQVAAAGATWLDRQLVRGGPPAEESALGLELRAALEARADRLVADGDAERSPNGRLTVKPGLLARRQAREIRGLGERLAGEIGLPFAEAAAGEDVSGVYRRRVQLASGAFALVERSRDFVLVPWRPVIEPQLGGPVHGVALAGGGVDWRLGRDRGPGV
jgi:type IV secretory pathway VirD2 relaxase